MYSTLIHCWSWAIAFLNLKCTPKVYNNGFVLTDDSDIVLLIFSKWQRLSYNPCPNKCDSHVRSSSYEDGITRSLLIWNVTFQVWTRKVKLPLTCQIKLPTKRKRQWWNATKFIKHALTSWNGVTFESWADDCQNKKIILSSQL